MAVAADGPLGATNGGGVGGYDPYGARQGGTVVGGNVRETQNAADVYDF
jgi:hypothetical protein